MCGATVTRFWWIAKVLGSQAYYLHLPILLLVAVFGGIALLLLYISHFFSPREQFFNNTLKKQSKLLETVTHAIPT
jgi:arginine exporter protein ArgO